jgi:uncharacterized protein YebE (UPF0316 family)
MDWWSIIGIGLLIMLARMTDVSIGTMRVISVVDGRMKMAFWLGFLEVIVWISVISVTLKYIEEEPLLALFFALGFSIGNVLGILLERKIPLGNLTLRVVGGEDVRTIASQIREIGLHATVLKGEGREGECLMMFTFMPKKYLKQVMKILEPMRDRIFYTLDYGGSSNQVLLPNSVQPTSPRRFFKRK